LGNVGCAGGGWTRCGLAEVAATFIIFKPQRYSLPGTAACHFAIRFFNVAECAAQSCQRRTQASTVARQKKCTAHRDSNLSGRLQSTRRAFCAGAGGGGSALEQLDDLPSGRSTRFRNMVISALEITMNFVLQDQSTTHAPPPPPHPPTYRNVRLRAKENGKKQTNTVPAKQTCPAHNRGTRAGTPAGLQ
jgi:hypothetical protein